MPDVTSAANPVTVFSFTMRFLNMYAPWAMPNDDITKLRKTKRDSSVSAG